MLNTIVRLSWAVLLLGAGHATARETLVIGVENQHYLPVYAYQDGAYRGFARDLFDAYARDRGYDIQYRALPVPRLYASFLDKQVDFKFPDNPQWKKDLRQGRTIHYSDPVVAFVDGTSVRPDRKGAPPEQIRLLGTMSGFTPWAWLDSLQAGKVALSENTSLEALVRQAVVGRVDGVYASVAVIHYQLDHVLKQPGALVFDPTLPYSRDHYHLSSIKRPEVLRDFNQWQRRNAGMIEALKRKHGVEKGVPSE